MRITTRRNLISIFIVFFACGVLDGCESTNQDTNGESLGKINTRADDFNVRLGSGGQFSARPITINLEGTDKAFLIPRNYFLPYLAADPDKKELSQFGFTLFFPDFAGYSRENADLAKYMAPTEQMVRVLEARGLSKLMFIISENKTVPAPPTAWGDTQALFDQRKPRTPLWTRQQYGLECQGWRDEPGSAAVCKGVRSNGEMIFIGVGDADEVIAGECDVIYASEKEGLYLRYRYWRKHLSKWREIDDAIWSKLHTWRAK